MKNCCEKCGVTVYGEKTEYPLYVENDDCSDKNCPCHTTPTTPTTPSEWGQIKIDVDEVLYDLTDHTLTFDEASAMMLKIVKQILHHNTEDIIEQCAKEAEEWLDDTEADETVKAILRVVAKQIRALKPTHKV